MRRNPDCINTTKGCVWGTFSEWETVEQIKKETPLTFLGKYTEYNGKNYIVLRSEETGKNYIIEL